MYCVKEGAGTTYGISTSFSPPIPSVDQAVGRGLIASTQSLCDVIFSEEAHSPGTFWPRSVEKGPPLVKGDCSSSRCS